MSNQMKNDVRMAQVLGVASIGLGLTEFIAPKPLERMLGLESRREHRSIVRLMGVREIMQGISILTSGQRPTDELKTSIWSRVAGDVMDIAALGAASRKTRRPLGIAAAAILVLGIGAADLICAQRLQRYDGQEQRPRRQRRFVREGTGLYEQEEASVAVEGAW